MLLLLHGPITNIIILSNTLFLLLRKVRFMSKGQGGKASDKHITTESGYLDNLRTNDLILADKGVDIQEMVPQKYVEIEIPAFTKGKSQTAHETESTTRLAHLHIHIEQALWKIHNLEQCNSS